MAKHLMLKPAGRQRDAGERDYLSVLTQLIDDYERKVFPLKPTSPLERLKFLIEESGTTQTKFREIIGLSQPAVSMILSGKRSLTIDAVKRLAAHFNLEAGYFI